MRFRRKKQQRISVNELVRPGRVGSKLDMEVAPADISFIHQAYDWQYPEVGYISAEQVVNALEALGALLDESGAQASQSGRFIAFNDQRMESCYPVALIVGYVDRENA